jgi:hypothetical protein
MICQMAALSEHTSHHEQGQHHTRPTVMMVITNTSCTLSEIEGPSRPTFAYQATWQVSPGNLRSCASKLAAAGVSASMRSQKISDHAISLLRVPPSAPVQRRKIQVHTLLVHIQSCDMRVDAVVAFIRLLCLPLPFLQARGIMMYIRMIQAQTATDSYW